jgi:hypothetical protein
MLNVAFHRRHTSAFLLFLLLIASSMLPVASGRAESGDYVRVIVVLRAPAAADGDGLMAPDAIAQVQEQFAPAAIAAGAREIARLDTLPVMIVEAPRGALNRLANHPLVANVAEDALAAPHLSGSVPLTHADQAQQAANGAGVAIAIVDTGVDAAHPFLGGRVIAEACFSTNNSAQGATSLCPGGGSQAFGPGAAAPCSLSNCDHGTHVAGIAAGNGGVAPGASIIAVQVFSKIASCSAFSLPSPCALSYVSDQLRAFDWLASTAFTPPLAIVNLSLGVGTFTSVAACDASLIGTAMFPAIANAAQPGSDDGRFIRQQRRDQCAQPAGVPVERRQRRRNDEDESRTGCVVFQQRIVSDVAGAGGWDRFIDNRRGICDEIGDLDGCAACGGGARAVAQCATRIPFGCLCHSAGQHRNTDPRYAQRCDQATHRCCGCTRRVATFAGACVLAAGCAPVSDGRPKFILVASSIAGGLS